MSNPHQRHLGELLDEIRLDYRRTEFLTGKSRPDQALLTAMQGVPRHRFVPESEQAAAYLNHPLAIGHGQTISQPYIVALMTDLLAPQQDHTVLEIGTGSGYQAAVLSRMVQQVYSIEIIPELAAVAEQRLHDLSFTNVTVKHGDGYLGWPEFAPFDGIMVTAAAPKIPQPLLEQLKPGARLVIPVGYPYGSQRLQLVKKDSNGDITIKNILDVRFVPMTGKISDDPQDDPQ